MQKKEEERWDNMKEGFLIRDEDARDHQADIAVKLRRLQQKQVYKKDLKEQLQVRMNLSNIKQRIAEAEEAKDKLFNDAKQAMKLEHKYNQEEADRKNEAKKRAIADDLGDAAAVRRAKEAASLEQAVRQAEEKAREESILRQYEHQEAIDAFLEHYSEEMAKKERRQHDERLAGYQERRRIDENVERLEKEEKEKMFWRERLEKEAQHVQMHQIARKKGDEKGKKLEQIKDYMNHMRGLDEEDEVFQKFAKMEIEAAEAKGMNTLPMRKAAMPGIECGRGPLFEGRGHIRPRYYSAVANNPDDISCVKRKVLHSDTKYRLGFML